MRVEDRFMAKTAKQLDGCWIWTAAIQRDTGYGRFGLGGGCVDYAHRAAYSLFKGEIPRGLQVCHKCDVRACVNPEHLFLGTRQDNMRDASRKGRVRIPSQSFASDETHQPAKLTNEQVRTIRRAPTTRGLAERFGVSRHSIWNARTGRTFKGVACE